MSLQGSFETIALADVMSLLASSNKSGELRVVGGHVEGRLWIQEGRLVASKVGKAHSHVDALFELLRLTEGNFAFHDGVEAPEAEAPTPVEPVMRQAEERLTEWRDIEAVVPSMDHRVRLVPNLPTPEVTLSGEDWKLVMAIALAGTVHGALEEVSVGQFDGCRGIRRLVDAGLVVVEPPRIRPSGPDPSRVARRAAANNGSGGPPRLARRVAAVENGSSPAVAVSNGSVSNGSAPTGSVSDLSALFEAQGLGRGMDRPRGDEDFAPAYHGADHFPTHDDEADYDYDDAVGSPLGRPSAPTGLVIPADDQPTPEVVGRRRGRRQPAVADHPDQLIVTTQSRPDAVATAPDGDTDSEAINRGLLLKFLSSVRS